MLDISVHQHVDAPPEAVARVLFDAARDAEWIGGAKRVDLLGPLPYGVGTSVRRYGAFLGRSFSWTTEITEFVPEHLVRMTHISGPFTGGVDYSIEPNERGSEVTISQLREGQLLVPVHGRTDAHLRRPRSEEAPAHCRGTRFGMISEHIASFHRVRTVGDAVAGVDTSPASALPQVEMAPSRL